MPRRSPAPFVLFVALHGGAAVAEGPEVIPWQGDADPTGTMGSGGIVGDERRGARFADIAAAGLDNACYPDADHLVAEYLYQNPDVCFWDVDEEARLVTAVPDAQVRADAVRLPPPSGGDDTVALERAINASSGRQVVGAGGVYAVGELQIRVPVEIHDMPTTPFSSAGTVIRVFAPDVRIFDSPIDGSGSSNVHTGFRVEDSADRFTLVRSGLSNVRHRAGANVSGVQLRGADDVHLACNTFENLVNQSPDRSRTARANSIWMDGNGRTTSSGGVIANNRAENHQSSGARSDAEFLTVQSFAATASDKPIRVFANRAVDAGKRFSKHQEGNALVLSNEHRWDTKRGPLGDRALLSAIAVHSVDDVVVRNNRIRIAAQSRFDHVFFTGVLSGDEAQDNVHFDCNDIEIADRLDPAQGATPYLFVARSPVRPRGATDLEATDSSASHNRVHGAGSVRYHYWFGEGYRRDGGRFETVDNVIGVPAIEREYK